jgi:hypothetical protein
MVFIMNILFECEIHPNPPVFLGRCAPIAAFDDGLARLSVAYLLQRRLTDNPLIAGKFIFGKTEFDTGEEVCRLTVWAVQQRRLVRLKA